MPYPNEHSCRLVNPDEVDVVGSGEREHEGKKYRVIFGKPKGGDGSVEQAYRYPVDDWSESEARAHCRAHDGIRFEPASRETSASAKRDQLIEYIHGKGFRRAEDLVAALVDLLGEALFNLVPESRGASASVELRFWAAVHSIETGEEERLATFYLLNTSLNRNRWRVTDKALEDALPGLLGRPLNCIPGYRVDHVYEPLQVGRWIKVDKSDGYALATAEITDDVAWEKLNSGEWGPVSVVIRAFKVTCSVCGDDVTVGPDEHIESGEGHEVIESFVFDRVDFVDEPAYPQAGMLSLGHVAETDGAVVRVYQASVVSFEETVKAPEDRAWDANSAEARVRSWAGGPDKKKISWSRYRRAFAWYDSGDPENFGSYKLPHHDIIDGRLSVVWRGVAAAMQVTLGGRDGVDIPQGDRRGVYNHLARHYRQFEKDVPPYHTSQSLEDGAQGPQGIDPKPEEKKEKIEMEEKITELESQLETLVTEKETLETTVSDLNDSVETLKAENQELKEDLEKRKQERHQELVNRALEARFNAGLVKDREAEAIRLKELDDDTLILLAEDAGNVAERLAKAQLTGPKAKYTPDAKSDFDAAVKAKREELFGYSRDAESKVVA